MKECLREPLRTYLGEFLKQSVDTHEIFKYQKYEFLLHFWSRHTDDVGLCGHSYEPAKFYLLKQSKTSNSVGGSFAESRNEKNAANTENKRRAKQSEHSCEQFVQNALYAYYIYSPRPPSLLLSMHKNTHMPPLIATDELLVDPFFESLRDCTRGFHTPKCKLHTASSRSRLLCSQVCIS